MMRLACGCADTTPRPAIVASIQDESTIRRRLAHECGRRWWQIEIREEGDHADR